MLEEKLDGIGMTATYRFIEENCGYNTAAYKTMLQNITTSNMPGRQGIIFRSSW